MFRNVNAASLAFVFVEAGQAAKLNAASRKRLRSRSPLAADLRMRSAIAVFGVRACISGLRLSHASSRTSRKVLTVSGSKDTDALAAMRYLSSSSMAGTLPVKVTTVGRLDENWVTFNQ